MIDYHVSWKSHNKSIFITFNACLLLLLLLPLPTYNSWWREAFNSGHTMIFIAISFFIYTRLTAKAPSLDSYLTNLFVLAAGMMIGVVIEAAQGLLGREASWDDLYKNLLGLMAGLALISTFYQKESISYKKQFFYVLTAFGFVLIGLLSLFQLSNHYIQRANAFPVILDFNAEWSDSFTGFNQSKMEMRSGKAGENESLFRIRFGAGSFPGISVIEPAPDWSAYRNLRFKVASGYNETTALFIRTHDKNHDFNYQDRFNQKLIIHSGLNEIVIPLAQIEKGPLNRNLDLTNIAGLTIFLSNVEKSHFLEISNIYLE